MNNNLEFLELLNVPFIFANVLMGKANGIKQEPRDTVRSSFGIGLSGQFSKVAVEMYYSLWTKGQKDEIKNGW